MGLLTDTRTQAFMSRLILAIHAPLEVLLYVAGAVSLLALAFTPFNARTYFSENALLPGLVERKYQSDQDVRGYVKELTRLAALDNGMGNIPDVWLEEQFMNLGLDVFTQNFTVKHPFMDSGNDSQAAGAVSGTNVYAILRAPRIASTEAMVFTVPYRNRQAEKDSGRTHFGIGLMLSLANFFSRNTYWSKDIIFVVVDKEEFGMQAWLEGYHDAHYDYIQSSTMLGRSGSIIAAINLELGSEITDHIDLKIEGLNGQLPNLDLFNLAVRLCKVERVQVTFQNRFDPSERQAVKWDGLKHSATTMLLNMANQASGKPNGIHGLFLRYHIEALTLQAHPANRGGAQLISIGRVLEGVLRSVNNLLERFHQSFFFYVLPGCERYVSIGLYMIPFSLLLLVPTLQGMALWIQASQPLQSGKVSQKDSEEKEKERNEKEQSYQTENENSDPQENEKSDQNDKEKLETKKVAQKADSQDEPHGRPFGQVMPLVIGAHIIGSILFISPEYFVNEHITSFSLEPKGALCIGFLAFFLGTSALPIFGRRNSFEMSDNLPSDWQLLKSLTLIWYTVTLLAVSMFNFSLAFFVAVPTIPVAIMVRPTQWRILRILQGLLLLLISPLALIYAFHTLHHFYFASTDPLTDIVVQGFVKTVDSIFDAVTSAYVFGNNSFALVTLVWFPVWFLLWIILFRKTKISA